MKKCMYLILTLSIAAFNANAQQAGSLNELLQAVRDGKIAESQENVQREQEFQSNRARQQQLLQQASRERQAEEARSARMEATFDENELVIAEQTDLLTKRLGSLKELFGVLQQAAGDARGQFDNSLTNIQYPDRGEFLTALAEKMGSTSQLASLEEIERLWFEIQREMIESGKVSKFSARVVVPGGDEVSKEIIRVGVFNLVSDGKYLKFDTETGKVSELLRQPQDRYVSSAESLTTTGDGLINFGVDPTRGQLLGLLVEEPSWGERATQQGGVIGWIIISLGGFALLIAAIRLVQITLVSMSVAAQKRNPGNPGQNPLGRVLAVYQGNKNIDVESLELKMGEAVLKELPGINRFNTLLKVIAVVAPLLGLLGTVTGMIITFQAITLFGTGDPKLMAGGISQALVTTMLGLCVAIPTVFLHALVSGRSKRLVEVLEEQATGLVAEASEQAHQA